MTNAAHLPTMRSDLGGDMTGEWDEIALVRLLEKIQGSDVFMALVTEAWQRDPTCLVQLGFAIMLEKPIYLMVPEGAKIPRALAKLADGIESYRATEDSGLSLGRLMDKWKGRQGETVSAMGLTAAEAIEKAAHIADTWADAYPEDIFLPPPPGEHGKTVDACSARAIRYAARKIAEEIRGMIP